MKRPRHLRFLAWSVGIGLTLAIAMIWLGSRVVWKEDDAFSTREEFLRRSETLVCNDLYQGAFYCGDESGRSWFIHDTGFGLIRTSFPADQWQPAVRPSYVWWNRWHWKKWDKEVSHELGDFCF